MVFGRRSTTLLEKCLGHRFKRPELLELALTHRSHANERALPEHYERLEFLGDAVLGMVAAEWLYRRHPHLPEGELSKLKAQLVSRTPLAHYAESLELGASLRLGVGEERSGGRGKPSLLADSMEAVFGAVFLDGGIVAACKVIHSMLGALEEPSEGPSGLAVADSKTRLQELVQALGHDLPEYRLVDAAGPDHSKVFTVECCLSGVPTGRGEGSSKKIAEQRAAADALERFAEET